VRLGCRAIETARFASFGSALETSIREGGPAVAGRVRGRTDFSGANSSDDRPAATPHARSYLIMTSFVAPLPAAASRQKSLPNNTNLISGIRTRLIERVTVFDSITNAAMSSPVAFFSRLEDPGDRRPAEKTRRLQSLLPCINMSYEGCRALASSVAGGGNGVARAGRDP